MTIKRSLSPARRGQQLKVGQQDEPAQIAAPASREYSARSNGTPPRKISDPAAEPKALTYNFLIANAGLEFRLSHSKQRPLKIPNRKWIAFSRLFSHACPPWRVTQHSPLATVFPWPPSTVDRGWRLIGTLGLEFSASPTKQSSGAISNRDTLGYLRSENLRDSFRRPGALLARRSADSMAAQ